MKDNSQRFRAVVGLKNVLASSAATASVVVDLRDANRASCAVVAPAASYTSANNITYKLQESDDNITFTDVASMNLVGTFDKFTATTTEDKILKVGYVGGKRYVKVVATLTGNLSVNLSAVWILDVESNPAK